MAAGDRRSSGQAKDPIEAIGTLQLLPLLVLLPQLYLLHICGQLYEALIQPDSCLPDLLHLVSKPLQYAHTLALVTTIDQCAGAGCSIM